MSARLIGFDLASLFGAWLAAWWFAAGLVLGAMANLRIHTLTGGAWGQALRPVALRLAARRAWLLPLAVPIVLGLRWTHPWAADRAAWLSTLDAPEFAAFWFSAVPLALRSLLYLVTFCWLTRVPRAGAVKPATLGLMAYGVVGSLAAIDLLMSLTAGWVSTAFALIALIGQMTTGAAVVVALTAWAAARAGAGPTTPRHEAHGAPRDAASRPPVWRDLGNLLLMYVMVQAYLQFMQFLIIWAENLPREIVWFVPRVQGAWGLGSLLLVLLQFAIPLPLLLWRRVKDSPGALARVAAVLVLGQVVQAAWLVLPTVNPHAVFAVFLAPALMVGMAALLLAPTRSRAGTARSVA